MYVCGYVRIYIHMYYLNTYTRTEYGNRDDSCVRIFFAYYFSNY